MNGRPQRHPTHTAGVEHTVLALFVLGVVASTTVFVHAMSGVSLSLPIDRPELQQPPVILSANLVEGTHEQNTPKAPVVNTAPENELPTILPSHVFLKVPFVSQAPLGVWTAPWNEACEEAAVFMAMQWVNRGGTITAKTASAEILRIIAFENATFGYHSDTTLRETAKIFTRLYRYDNIKLSYDITLDDVRRELASGNIVLLPVAGSLLKNPYFATPPPYHMVVAVGYDDSSREIIVQEPGTRRGENYRYAYDILSNAIHDWTGSDATITTGRKGMIVVHPVTAE